MTKAKIDLSRFKQIIEGACRPGPPSDKSYQSACVFLLLFSQDNPHILAIQKADRRGYPWRNQIALPGGHIDEGDPSPVEAAFRELEEEMNIRPNQIELVGSAGHFQTISKRDIEVFIGIWNEKGPIRFDSTEISRIFMIPLKHLVQIHVNRHYHGRIPDVPELKYPVEDVMIWGVTARILHYFIELSYPIFKEFGWLGARR